MEAPMSTRIREFFSRWPGASQAGFCETETHVRLSQECVGPADQWPRVEANLQDPTRAVSNATNPQDSEVLGGESKEPEAWPVKWLSLSFRCRRT